MLGLVGGLAKGEILYQFTKKKKHCYHLEPPFGYFFAATFRNAIYVPLSVT
jgi:hypothetical protein